MVVIILIPNSHIVENPFKMLGGVADNYYAE